jgi:hypothetical protein
LPVLVRLRMRQLKRESRTSTRQTGVCSRPKPACRDQIKVACPPKRLRYGLICVLCSCEWLVLFFTYAWLCTHALSALACRCAVKHLSSLLAYPPVGAATRTSGCLKRQRASRTSYVSSRQPCIPRRCVGDTISTPDTHYSALFRVHGLSNP